MPDAQTRRGLRLLGGFIVLAAAAVSLVLHPPVDVFLEAAVLGGAVAWLASQ